MLLVVAWLMPLLVWVSLEREKFLSMYVWASSTLTTLFSASAGHQDCSKDGHNCQRETDVKQRIMAIPVVHGTFSHTYSMSMWFYRLYQSLWNRKTTDDETEGVLKCLLLYLTFWAYTYAPKTPRKPPDPRRSWRTCKRWMRMLLLLMCVLNSCTVGVMADSVISTVHQCLQTEDPSPKDASRCPTLDPLLMSEMIQSCGYMDCGMKSHMALAGRHQHPLKSKARTTVKSGLKANLFNSWGKPIEIIIDTGASKACSGHKEDFVELSLARSSKKLDGIAEGLPIEGAGILNYVVTDDSGNQHTLNLNGYYVPNLAKDMRLVPPQGIKTTDDCMGTYVGHCNDGEPDSYAKLDFKAHVPGWQEHPPLSSCTIKYHPRTNLPVMTGYLPMKTDTAEKVLHSAVCVTEESNQNLTPSQRELLKWHYRLGHIGFRHIQWLVRSGKIAVQGNAKAVANCAPPKCAACEYGKACRRPAKTSKTIHCDEKEMELKKGDLYPGQRISADHYQSAIPGRLYTSRGSTDPKDMFHGGCIFVDHASGYIDVRHQVTLNAADTVKAKLQFERDAFTQGVVVQAYHTDNGVFTSKEFMQQLLGSNQRIRMSGAGTGHQNGVAEQGIQTVVNMARTMLLHAALRSPEGVVTSDLWPMAMDHAVWLYN